MILLKEGTFTMGLYISFINTLILFCAMLVKKCVFDQEYGGRKTKSLVLYWMCCLKISDPFVTHNKNKAKKKKLEKETKRKR